MTEKELRSLLDIWKSRLGLDQWKINLIIESCEDDTSYMEVERSVSYQRARITVNPWMLGKGKIPQEVLQDPSDETIEQSLVHELLHICVRDLSVIIRNDLDGLLHRDVHTSFQISAARAEERCVDSLAVALCQAFRK